MPSPFPGMDPFLEVSHLFEDFHGKLIGDIERELSRLVPERYVVRTSERSYVALAQADDGDERQSFLPDVAVTSSAAATKRPRRGKGPAQASSGPGTVLMRPLIKAE